MGFTPNVDGLNIDPRDSGQIFVTLSADGLDKLQTSLYLERIGIFYAVFLYQ